MYKTSIGFEIICRTRQKKIKNCRKLLKQITEIEAKEKQVNGTFFFYSHWNLLKGITLNEDQKRKKSRKAELEEEIAKLTEEEKANK